MTNIDYRTIRNGLWNRIINYKQNCQNKDEFVLKLLNSILSALNTASLIKEDEVLTADYYLSKEGF